MTEKRIVKPLTVPSSHMHDWKSYTNIAVFAGSLEVESEWIYIYYVMGGCSRVTLAHLKSPYSRNKQLVYLGGRLFGAQRITDQCDSSVIQISVIFFLLHFPVRSFLHRFEVHIAVAHTQLTHLHFEILFVHPEDLCVEHLECWVYTCSYIINHPASSFL